VFVEETLIKGFDKGERRRQNPVYTKLIRPTSSPELAEERRALIRNNKVRAKLPNDPDFLRVRYVRYADDFILGVIGSKAHATRLLVQIRDFLEDRLKLALSPEKSKVTHATTDKARFLGVDIRITPDKSNPFKTVQYKGRENKTVKGTTRPQLLAPTTEIVAKLGAKGYLKEGRPTRVGRLIYYTPEMIVQNYL